MNIGVEFWDYIDGSMHPTRRRAFEKEIDSNPDSKMEFETLMTMHNLLKNEESRAPSEGFTDRVMQALPSKINRRHFQRQWSKRGLLLIFLGWVFLLMGVAVATTEYTAMNIPVEFSLDEFMQSPQLSLFFVVFIGVFVLLNFDHFLTRRSRSTH